MTPSILENVDKDLYPVLPQFLDNLDDDLDELEDHLTDGALDDVRRIAHGIKGSAGSFGLESFRERALAVEEAVESSESIEAKFQELVDHVESVRDELESRDQISL